MDYRRSVPTFNPILKHGRNFIIEIVSGAWNVYRQAFGGANRFDPKRIHPLFDVRRRGKETNETGMRKIFIILCVAWVIAETSWNGKTWEVLFYCQENPNEQMLIKDLYSYRD